MEIKWSEGSAGGFLQQFCQTHSPPCRINSLILKSKTQKPCVAAPYQSQLASRFPSADVSTAAASDFASRKDLLSIE